jgi:hypothetical protein
VLLWDNYSALSGSVDKTIRYFDVRDWGSEQEESEAVNGYHYSKYLMGHKSSVTQLKRLNNS